MPEFDAVEYLSLRLYPAKAVNKARAEVSDGRIKDAADDYVRGADIFEKALKALSPSALKVLVDDEQELEAMQVQTHQQSQENTRFFHRLDASADFSFWAKQPCWSLDEAVALILGKEPKVVNWERIKPMIPFSEFAERFSEIRQHLNKARAHGQLMDPVRPDLFYRWARARGVTLPANLEALLDNGRGDPEQSGDSSSTSKAAEGKTGAEARKSRQGKSKSVKPRKAGGKQADDHENIIHLDREESRLKAIRDRVTAELPADVLAPPDLADDLAQSLRKMVLAMAIGRYGYRPRGGRQSTVTDISDDLKAAGIELPKGAVRTLLEQASACMPQTENSGKGARATG